MGISSKQWKWLFTLGLTVLFTVWQWTEARKTGDSSAAYGAMVVTFAIFVSFGSYLILMSRDKSKTANDSLLQQSALLEAMVVSDFAQGDFVFATQKDEVVIARISETLLKEFRSSGTTRSGGYGGVSVPVFGRVRANVGGYSGSSTRNPEESTPIDSGVSTFTNQRIVFAGSNVVREFELDKLVNLEAGDNGITLNIAVSNRDKASVLASVNFTELTPGIAASIATAYQEEGKAGAIKRVKEVQEQIAGVLAAEAAKSKRKPKS